MNLQYEDYRLIFIVATILFVLLLVVSIVLFFTLDIKGAIGHVTGRTAKKQIQKIKESAHANSEKLSNPGQAQVLGEGRITDKISTQKLTNTTDELADDGSSATTVLSQEGSDATTVLSQSGLNETTVLSQSGLNETTVLSQEVVDEKFNTVNNNIGKNVFSIDFDITFIHTNEVVN